MASRALLALGSFALATSLGAQVAVPIQLAPTSIEWKEAPSSMPAKTRIAIIEGDPKKPGLFTLRVRTAPGFRLVRHTHPQDERVTVLDGTVHVVIGAGKDEKDVTFPRGSFYVTPAGVPHTVYADVEAELQITGWGPWEVRVVDAK